MEIQELPDAELKNNCHKEFKRKMHEQNQNFKKDTENIEKNQIEILALKKITELKN